LRNRYKHKTKGFAMGMGKKGLIAGLIGAGFAFSAPAALAQAQPDLGFYIGGSLGQMDASGSCIAGVSCDFKDSSWKIFGGYRFHPNFAAEAFYANWGEISLRSGPLSVTGEVSTVGIAALGIVPLGHQFALFGKLGFGNTDQEFTATAPGLLASESNDGTEMILGFGATYSLTSNLGLRAEWETLNDSEVDIISIGIQYRF
jgi:OOP family OmpA-OmpF porin